MPTGSRSFPIGKCCTVCENPKARYNYCGLSCISCKSFFIRATLSVYPYECQKDGNCAIIASSPDYCKGCRYKKCLEAGMNPHLVGRRPRFYEAVGQITNRHELVQRHVTPMLSLGFHFVAYATKNMGPTKFARFFCNVDKMSTTNPSEDQVNHFNMNVSLKDAFMNSSLFYSKDQVLTISEKDMVRCMFAHGYCKYFVAIVDFASAVPEMRQLSTADMMKLLQYNRNEIAMIKTFYFHHLNPLRNEKQNHIVEQLGLFSKDQASIWKHFYKFYDEQVDSVFEELKISAEEMILLRLIAMFSPFRDCSDEGVEVLRKARGKYINILTGYQNEAYPKMDPHTKIKRLQTMLRFLTDFSIDMHFRYTAFVLNNVDNLLGPLSYDLQVREYHD